MCFSLSLSLSVCCVCVSVHLFLCLPGQECALANHTPYAFDAAGELSVAMMQMLAAFAKDVRDQKRMQRL